MGRHALPALLGSLLTALGRAPLVALGVAMAVRHGGRALGKPALAALAVPLSVLAGWVTLLPDPHALLRWPGGMLERLPGLGAIVLVAGLAGEKSKGGPGLLAAVAGWWLVGAPHDRAALAHDWPAWLAMAAVIAALIWIMRDAATWALLAAAAVLWAALQAAGAPPAWSWAALCVAGAGIAAMGGGAPAGLASILSVTALAADLGVGRLRGGGFAVADAACLAPVLLVLVAGRLPGARPGARSGAAKPAPQPGR